MNSIILSIARKILTDSFAKVIIPVVINKIMTSEKHGLDSDIVKLLLDAIVTSTSNPVKKSDVKCIESSLQ